MRKKLDTRFPAARIKKIMQADEDVGKIALAVPVLVSKALELFLQDLCDRTYSITLQRGMKTMSSLHLKHCVHSFNHYDFLRELVSKVPDMGTIDGASEDRSVPRRRKAAEEDESEEESKRARAEAVVIQPSSGTGRGRGRPRGSGRGRRGGARSSDRDPSLLYDNKYEDDPGTSPPHIFTNDDSTLNTTDTAAAEPVRNFDLNLDVSGHAAGPSMSAAPVAPAATGGGSALTETNKEEYPGWSIADMKQMAIDPVQFALSKQRADDEDYDNEEEG